MSTGGNVPTQGTTQEALSPQKKRGDRGVLGKGTRSKRLKSLWRKRPHAATSQPISLRSFVRDLAKYRGTEPELVLCAKDATEWLHAKANPPKRVPKPRMEKAAESKGSINVPKKAAGGRR